MAPEIRGKINVTFDDIAIDPEFESLIPQIGKEEFEQLEANIRRYGQRDPLVVWTTGGKCILLDGHNRYRILKRARQQGDSDVARTFGPIAYAVEAVPLKDREAALLWIEENQVGRRNLTDDQRAMIWASILERREKLSRANAAAAARDAKANPGSVADKTAATERKPREEEKAAKESGLAVGKLRTAKKVRKTNPKAAEAVRRGKKTLRQAKREMKPAPTFLPDLKVGDEVTIAWNEAIGGKLDGIGFVEKLTFGSIYVKLYDVYNTGKVARFLRENGHGQRSHLCILRIATDQDRQHFENERKAEEQRQRDHMNLKAKSSELVSRIPAEFHAKEFFDGNRQLGLSFTGLTLEQLEEIVEALQPALVGAA